MKTNGIASLGVAAVMMLAPGCDSGDGSSPAPTFELRLVDRFGSVDGNLSLQRISGVGLSQGRGDTLFVRQRGVANVLVLSPQGDSLATIGRYGAGPGELTPVASLAVHKDTLWIGDISRTISLFSPDGDFLDRVRASPEPLRDIERAPYLVGPLADGSLLFRAGTTADAVAEGDIEEVAYARVSRQGQVLDTVLLASVSGSAILIRSADGYMSMGRHPVDRSDRVALSPRGEWLVVAAVDEADLDPAAASLAWIDLDGDTLLRRTIRAEPRSTDDARDRYIEGIMNWGPTGGSRAAAERALDEAGPWPPFHPPVDQLFVDLDERVWIATTHASADSTRWRVFSREGDEFGTVDLPARVTLEAATGPVVWGWTTGPYDVPYLLKFRIVH